MSKKHYLLPIPLALAVGHAFAQELPEFRGEEVLVTAAKEEQPLKMSVDPRAPRQPLPSADGAGLLKGLPGFNVIRKGGASGDPLLRGLGGSRLAILADGNFVFGGCGGRMDPPTAYLYPDAYDEVNVVKGPQSVKLGPGLISGGVNFERKTKRFDEAGVRFNGSLTGGNADRNDVYADAAFGSSLGYVRAIASHNHGGDYKDGNGAKVHSSFDRDSQTLIAGLTPDRDTTLELALDRSRGQAAYADRGMDGSKFDRDAWSFKAERRNLSGWLDALRLQLGHSYVDHVMDNYSLRPQTAPASRSAMNPDRSADTGRLAADMAFGDWEVSAGFDWLSDRHRSRMGKGVNAGQYVDQPRAPNQSFDNHGVYAEASHPLGAGGKLIAGLRRDQTQAVFEPKAAAMGKPAQARQETQYQLNAGFLRYEHTAGSWTRYVGLGQAERAPDFWERNKSPSLNSETNRQLDAGLLYRDDKLQGSLSAYASRVQNFILVEGDAGAIGGKARNIDARRYGFEGDLSWRFAPEWTLSGSLAWVWAANLDENRPLGQTPPLDAKAALKWDNGKYAAGLTVRGVQRQDRVAPGQGNIVGTDIGATPGFGVVSLDGGLRLNKHAKLLVGVDNLFNKAYAESVSKGGAMVAGYERTLQVNEPGRTVWGRVQLQF